MSTQRVKGLEEVAQEAHDLINPKPEVCNMRNDTSVVERVMLDWKESVIKSRQALLSVELVRKNIEPEISIHYVSEQVAEPFIVIKKNIILISGVVDVMTEQRIVLPGYTSLECDWRRRLLRWYEEMNDAQKCSIPVFGNKIKIKGFLDQVESLTGLKSVKNLPLIKATLDEIHCDLLERGVLDENYKKVNQRELNKKGELLEKKSPDYVRFFRYRETPATVVDQLASGEKEPFSHLMHLFALASLGSNFKSGISNYIGAYVYFSRSLVQAGYSGLEPIKEMIEVNSLIRFKRYLEELMIRGKISSGYSNTIISSARVMMKTARSIQGVFLEPFIAASGFEVVSETDMYKPYTPSERDRISEAITTAIESTNALLKPYIKSGEGLDPLSPSGKVKRGFATLKNARWIFENKLSCVPVGFKTADRNDPYQKAFISIIQNQNKSIYDIYKSWGVLYARDSFVLAPYVARLAQVTGLNSDSLIRLGIADFEECHSVTNKPCIRYWKERSTGAKEYHLDIFDADISWLTVSQGREVKKVFEDVISLTAEFRSKADPDVASQLFIYRSTSPRAHNQIKSLAGSAKNTLNRIFMDFSLEYGLVLDSGEPLKLSPSRLRPSFVSELVERGVSLREVQVILGHKSMLTTIGYLDKHDLNRASRKILNESLINMHHGTVDIELEARRSKGNSLDESVLFKTPLGGCRNILNPPEFIKKTRGYIPGRPCSLYNKCLSCDNRILKKANLPDLFAMRRDYLHTLESSGVADTPYGAIILENLALLEEILDPSMSDFSIEELEEADRLSDYIETNVVIEGVMQ